MIDPDTREAIKGVILLIAICFLLAYCSVPNGIMH